MKKLINVSVIFFVAIFTFFDCSFSKHDNNPINEIERQLNSLHPNVRTKNEQAASSLFDLIIDYTLYDIKQDSKQLGRVTCMSSVLKLNNLVEINDKHN